MWKLLKLAPLVVLVPVVAACASMSATSKSADRPALVIPLPPPHVVPLTPEPVVEPVVEVPPAPSSAAPKPPARPAPRPSASEARGEAKPGETKPPETPPQPEPATPTAPPAPAPQLRTAESTGAEGVVRATIDRARNLLNEVDYRRLNNERKKAYDDAKRFAQQADDALKAGNTVFAQGVATKAETLAKELAGK